MTLVDCRELVGRENRIVLYVELDRASGGSIVVKAVMLRVFQPASSPANVRSSATAKRTRRRVLPRYAENGLTPARSKWHDAHQRVFRDGYTNEKFGSMADSNQEVLDK